MSESMDTNEVVIPAKAAVHEGMDTAQAGIPGAKMNGQTNGQGDESSHGSPPKTNGMASGEESRDTLGEERDNSPVLIEDDSQMAEKDSMAGSALADEDSVLTCKDSDVTENSIVIEEDSVVLDKNEDSVTADKNDEDSVMVVEDKDSSVVDAEDTQSACSSRDLASRNSEDIIPDPDSSVKKVPNSKVSETTPKAKADNPATSPELLRHLKAVKDAVGKVSKSIVVDDDDVVVTGRSRGPLTSTPMQPIPRPSGPSPSLVTQQPRPDPAPAPAPAPEGGSNEPKLRPMAKLLTDLGLDLARQQVYKDLIKIQNKKDAQKKLGDKEKKQLEKLVVAYDNIVVKNLPFSFEVQRCNNCKFNSESANIMELHKEYAHHPAQGPSICECSYCDFTTTYPGDYFMHMDRAHKKRGRLSARLGNYVCHNCTFQTNARKTFLAHSARCERSFRLSTNLVPNHSDSDICLYPPTPPPKKTPPAPPPAVGRSLLPPAQRMVRPGGMITTAVPPRPVGPVVSGPQGPLPVGQQLFKVGSSLYTLVHSQGQAFLAPYHVPPTTSFVSQPALPARPANVTRVVPAIPSGPRPASLAHPAATKGMSISEILAVNNAPQLNPARQFPAKQVFPRQPAPQKNPAPSGFEVCEICGGFVKDKESLRIHFFYAHKVEFPAELFRTNKPSLLCDLCKARFWTYQGLVRHVQTAHQAADKKQPEKPVVAPPTMCPICGEKNYPLGLRNHLVARHNVSIRKMMESHRCFVCKLNFKVFFQLKVHIVKAHSHVIPNLEAFLSFQKSLGIMKSFMPPASTKPPEEKTSTEEMVSRDPHKCSRCSQRFPYPEVLQKHYKDVHKNEKEECPLCSELIAIGRPYVRHMKREHCPDCSVKLQSLSEDTLQRYLTNGKEGVNLGEADTPGGATKRKSDEVLDAESDKENHKKRKVDVESAHETDSSLPDLEETDAVEGKKVESGPVEEVLEVNGETIVVQQT